MRSRLLFVACVMAATGGYLRLVAATDFVPAADGLSVLPLQIEGWRGRDLGRLDPETEAILQADSYLMRAYTRGDDGAPLTLFVAYYGTQRAGHTMHSPLNCLPGTGWEWVERGRQRVSIAPGREIETNRNVARKNGEQDLVYYWYQSRSRVVASDYRNKLLLVQDALTLHRSDGALVRVTMPILSDAQSTDDAASFIRAMYVPLTQHLPE
jgi:EpsI family protein